jgi:hypothetical protein
MLEQIERAANILCDAFEQLDLTFNEYCAQYLTRYHCRDVKYDKVSEESIIKSFDDNRTDCHFILKVTASKAETCMLLISQDILNSSCTFHLPEVYKYKHIGLKYLLINGESKDIFYPEHMLIMKKYDMTLSDFILTTTISFDDLDEYLYIFIFQILFTISILRHIVPSFQHNDLHTWNIMIQKNPDYTAGVHKYYYYYGIEHVIYKIPVCPYYPIIIDFGWSNINVNYKLFPMIIYADISSYKTNIHNFGQEFAPFFNDTNV